MPHVPAVLQVAGKEVGPDQIGWDRNLGQNLMINFAG